MLEEVIESAKTQFVERLASPLLGSFAISWALWNYKFLVILFSATTVSQTFLLIEKHAFPDYWTMGLRGFLYPLAIAFVYIFWYPHVAKFVYRAVRRHALAMDEIRKEYDGKELLTLEKSRQLRAEIALSDAAHKLEVDRLNEKISELKDVQGQLANEQLGLNEKQRLEIAAMQPDSMLPDPSATPSDLSAEMQKVLATFVDDSDATPEDAVIARSGLETVSAKFALGELVKFKLLTFRANTRGKFYDLTHEGRRSLLMLRKKLGNPPG